MLYRCLKCCVNTVQFFGKIPFYDLLSNIISLLSKPDVIVTGSQDFAHMIVHTLIVILFLMGFLCSSPNLGPCCNHTLIVLLYKRIKFWSSLASDFFIS